MKILKVSLITQERKVLDEEAVSVTLPGIEGEFTVLPGHINFFTQLKPGVVVMKTPEGKEDRLVTVYGGFVDVGAEEVRILAETALRADEIDEAKALEAKKEAEKALKNKQDKQQFVEAQTALRKALLELDTARKWKKMKGGN